MLAFLDGVPTLDLELHNELFNIHNIQPLPGDQFLLVCARSDRRGPADFDQNGRVYSRSGEFVQGYLLGDGIQDIQTTSSGTIWTSFFDEGIFGNFGWSSPIGVSGLVAWDVAGNKLYEYERAAGLDYICDCYAMNVESESSIWIYYYT